jgi:two-component system, NarL family, response regulator DevR
LWAVTTKLHRVLLVDDHEIVREGLAALIDSSEDLTVVGQAGSVEEAVRRTGFDEPDVVVLDVRLPDGSGVEACREIRARFPEVKVLMLTSFADEEALMAAILAGASGVRAQASARDPNCSTASAPSPRADRFSIRR